MSPLRIMVVIGTRPEAIKLMPIIVAARAQPDRFALCIARTGQHRELVDELMHEFGIEADFDLDLMRHDQDLAHLTSESIKGLSGLIAEVRPQWVLVQGDTTATFAGALAAFYNRVAVGHVEAGLRTHDRRSPFPEEANRSLTARLADLHFAPTARARSNLLAEGIADETIVVTGNTVVDALRLTLAAAGPSAQAGDPAPEPYVLVTIHRRENHGEALVRICHALRLLLERRPSLRVRLPMHPNPRMRALLHEHLCNCDRITLTEPLGHRDFIVTLAGAALVMTDSGGVQEECTILGKPVLVLRSETERTEAVDQGVAMLVGTDAVFIATAAERILEDPNLHATMARRSEVFGDGYAAQMILDALANAPRSDRPGGRLVRETTDVVV